MLFVSVEHADDVRIEKNAGNDVQREARAHFVVREVRMFALISEKGDFRQLRQTGFHPGCQRNGTDVFNFTVFARFDQFGRFAAQRHKDDKIFRFQLSGHHFYNVRIVVILAVFARQLQLHSYFVAIISENPLANTYIFLASYIF